MMMISSVHKEKQSSKPTSLIESEKGSLVVKQNRRRKLPNFNYLLTGLTGTTSLAVVVTFLLAVPAFKDKESNMMTNYDALCQQMVKKDAAVTQGQLQKLRGKEGVQKSVIHQILGSPYCVLPKTSIRWV